MDIRNYLSIVSEYCHKRAKYPHSRSVGKKFFEERRFGTMLSFNSQQWDAPNGMAPIQWAGFRGAMNYGFTGLAKKIKNNWTSTIEHIFKKSGKVTEKYNVFETEIAASG